VDFTMTSLKSDQQLDISGVVIPFGLLLCTATLARMPLGAVLHISLQDNDTLRDLLIILERSEDRILAWEQQGDCYHVWVQKSRSRKPGEKWGPGQAKGQSEITDGKKIAASHLRSR
jgi:TusA-related sulfurtransferase